MAAITDVLGPVGAIPGIGPIVIGVIQVVGFIASIFGFGFGGGDVSALATAVQNLQKTVATAVQSLTRFAWSIAYGLGLLLQWVHDFFVGLLGTIWSLIKKLGGLIRNLYDNVLPTLLRIIKRARDFLNQVYLKYVRPLLQWIQLARKFLAILRIFHIAWAAKLDGYLVKLQGYILTPFLYVLRQVNGLGSWINAIITAAGLIQRAVFINTMFAYQRDWVSIFWYGQANAPSTALPATPPPQYPPPPAGEVTGELKQYFATGTGPIADGAAVCSHYIDLTLAEYS